MTLEPVEWHGSVLGSECTFHQIAPYIGKMKSSMAREIVEEFSSPGDLILDPFAGSGAIALEAVIAKRGIICNDINPYAIALTKAKIMAPATIDEALIRATKAADSAMEGIKKVSLEQVPVWVKAFFHPETLREIIQFVNVVNRSNDHFLMACLLGILHHQRPGFLSYPSSHLVPYLRYKKFPKEQFPELYNYRPLKPRLMAKIYRTYRRPAEFDSSLFRKCMKTDVRDLQLEAESIDTVITSPPYMDALDYGRDNRLRLWFLGIDNYKNYSPPLGSIDNFSNLMISFLKGANHWLRNEGHVVCVVGEVSRQKRSVDIARLLANIATQKIGGFMLESIITDEIPNDRRSRKGSYVKTESVVSLVKRRN